MKKILINFLKGVLLTALFFGHTANIKADSAGKFFEYLWKTATSKIDSSYVSLGALIIIVGGIVRGTNYWYTSAEDQFLLFEKILQLIKDHPNMSATLAIVAAVCAAFYEPKKQKDAPSSKEKKKKEAKKKENLTTPIATIYTGTGKGKN